MPLPEAKTASEKAEIKRWLKDRNKYPSGFCNNINKPAQCEGTKPRSNGKPLKTCPFWMECPCACHRNVDKLFEMTGMERVEMPNPEYAPNVLEFVMPEVEDPIGSTVALSDDGTMTPPDHERPVAANVGTATPPLAQRRTPTGRAARGGLEAQVWEGCHALATSDDPLTPKVIAAWIADKYAIPTPSSGAVNAVWDRWTKLGFATQAKKPNRFTGFTGEGGWQELVRMKTSAKTAKRSQRSAALRGFR